MAETYYFDSPTTVMNRGTCGEGEYKGLTCCCSIVPVNSTACCTTLDICTSRENASCKSASYLILVVVSAVLVVFLALALVYFKVLPYKKKTNQRAQHRSEHETNEASSEPRKTSAHGEVSEITVAVPLEEKEAKLRRLSLSLESAPAAAEVDSTTKNPPPPKKKTRKEEQRQQEINLRMSVERDKAVAKERLRLAHAATLGQVIVDPAAPLAEAALPREEPTIQHPARTALTRSSSSKGVPTPRAKLRRSSSLGAPQFDDINSPAVLALEAENDSSLVMAPSVVAATSAPNCGRCEENVADRKCEECGVSLCPSCDSVLHGQGLLKNHNVFTLSMRLGPQRLIC